LTDKKIRASLELSFSVRKNVRFFCFLFSAFHRWISRGNGYRRDRVSTVITKEVIIMGKDPVCSGEVDERSPWSSTYQGKTYYFNSAECKADFDRDPAHFAAVAFADTAEESSRTREKGGQVASRARTKLRSMIGDGKGKAAERISSVSGAFRTVSQHLREQNQESMARYADKAAVNVEQLSGYLQQHDADQIISEAEDFVRRRPVLMAGGAFAAGFFMARFLKSSKSASA